MRKQTATHCDPVAFPGGGGVDDVQARTVPVIMMAAVSAFSLPSVHEGTGSILGVLEC